MTRIYNVRIIKGVHYSRKSSSCSKLIGANRGDTTVTRRTQYNNKNGTGKATEKLTCARRSILSSASRKPVINLAQSPAFNSF